MPRGKIAKSKGDLVAVIRHILQQGQSQGDVKHWESGQTGTGTEGLCSEYSQSQKLTGHSPEQPGLTWKCLCWSSFRSQISLMESQKNLGWKGLLEVFSDPKNKQATFPISSNCAKKGLGFLNALFSGRSIFEPPEIERALGSSFFQQRK